MSKTYKQSSKPTPLKLKIDPKNYYLSYFPRQKLTAEMIRDNILVSSGLFVDKIGGPSVKPYQPPGLWDELTGGSTSNSLKRYTMSTNGNQYRRSLYTYWKRTAPPPGMITFDAMRRTSMYASSGNTQEVSFNAAGQVIGQVKQVESVKDVIYRMINEYLDSVERLNELLPKE